MPWIIQLLASPLARVWVLCVWVLGVSLVCVCACVFLLATTALNG